MGCTLTTEEVAHIDQTIAKLREQLEYDRQTSRSRAELIDRLQDENDRLRKLVRDLWLTGSLCGAIPDVRLQADGGDWRTMQERVDEALGIEVDG